jgi:hypothetical protein
VTVGVTFIFAKESGDDGFGNHFCLATENNRDRFGHVVESLRYREIKAWFD